MRRLGFYLGRLRETLNGLEVAELRRKAAAELANCFRCEAHNEAIATALELVRQVRQDERFGVEDELDELMS